MTHPPALARRLGTTDAVSIGLASMIGAGIFAVFAPAAGAAGAGLLIGLAVAAMVAVCNATSSAQLAAQYPTSGGTYAFGRERLGEWPGFLAGWSFVIGKTASCAAMALTFAAYAVPAGWQQVVAVAAILLLTGVNSLGITRTARLSRVIVSVVLAVLALVIVLGGVAASRGADGDTLSPLTAGLLADGWYGVLQSAGLLFFAFAGYARIATLGEEVRDPARTIPRAILLALAGTLALYAAIAFLVLTVLGAEGLAASATPLGDLAAASGASWAVPIVGVGAALASLGALLALIAGVGRTSLAMARNGDLPCALAAVHPRYLVPRRAEFALALVACAMILLTDLRGAIGFSSFGVLLYYFITNLSALTQDRAHRRYPRVLPVLGALGCLTLVVTLPPASIGVGVLVLLAGVLGRVVAGRILRGRPR
ncbi:MULTISPECIES: APC family permease [unclassified Leucobacter]|uniref:APC family permease n=1 Tax=unclassified Leucobacter TaxID=2621730 RepID=UPI00165DC0F2|nr:MULTISPECIES: APC family permease [unclassified Leucobacter]MBC9926128.1 amino acid permease [Leucobacter sp. cx-169]